MQPFMSYFWLSAFLFLGFSTVLAWHIRTSDLRLFTMDKCLTELPASTQLLPSFTNIVFRSVTLSLSDVPLTFLC